MQVHFIHALAFLALIGTPWVVFGQEINPEDAAVEESTPAETVSSEDGLTDSERKEAIKLGIAHPTDQPQAEAHGHVKTLDEVLGDEEETNLEQLKKSLRIKTAELNGPLTNMSPGLGLSVGVGANYVEHSRHSPDFTLQLGVRDHHSEHESGSLFDDKLSIYELDYKASAVIGGADLNRDAGDDVVYGVKAQADFAIGDNTGNRAGVQHWYPNAYWKLAGDTNLNLVENDSFDEEFNFCIGPEIGIVPYSSPSLSVSLGMGVDGCFLYNRVFSGDAVGLGSHLTTRSKLEMREGGDDVLHAMLEYKKSLAERSFTGIGEQDTHRVRGAVNWMIADWIALGADVRWNRRSVNEMIAQPEGHKSRTRVERDIVEGFATTTFYTGK